jgi:putative ABC transport system permease protein
MMSAPGSGNRAMFWRIIRRLLGANRGRLFVILLALGAGAAVTAALLNLQVDAERRISTEFHALGANAIITSRNSISSSEPGTIPESLLKQLPEQNGGQPVPRAAFLYATVNVTVYSDEDHYRTPRGSGTAVVTGYDYVAEDLGQIAPYRVLEGGVVVFDTNTCRIGASVSTHFQLHVKSALVLAAGKSEKNCYVDRVWSFGGPEDNQIFMGIETAQELTGLTDRASVIALRIPGTPKQIEDYLGVLQRQFLDVEVRPIRQFTEGEARIYSRISGLLTATVVIVLLLTGLCVMAAMTNVAMERKNDVGLMKAIGGATRRVLRLFMMEAALLGLVGGVIGAAVGVFLSIWLGKQVFGVAAQPRLIVYPVSVALTTIVAILSAYPLRRLASVRPASVFRGEA